ncbi:MAG: carboxypeptidase regulatory-like domain-containing protein [Acidobacteria bacterium]|nr:carboxypeptidase regulatory-like domain-containing protein [Acidobacteriota bacterium]
MTCNRLIVPGFIGVGIIVLAITSLAGVSAQQPAVAIDNDDIGGVVTSTKGPEAGVWVIAETRDLPTRLAKMVVTDDQGRYVLPDLPKANYTVWVRGYGLVDSPNVRATPGSTLNLTAVIAPNARAAAEYYPANYWYSLLRVPDKSEFPGKGAKVNGIVETVRSQAEWMGRLRMGSCEGCHQMGNRATREIPGMFKGLSSVDAWRRRVQSGQAGGGMYATLNTQMGPRSFELFADWTDRIAKGEYPTEAPPRPQGRERDVVVTIWDWADPKAYLHDEVTSDKRNPTVNANGPVYGALEAAADYVPVLDPVRHATSRLEIPVDNLPAGGGEGGGPMLASPYWGEEVLWHSKAVNHTPMMDQRARTWYAARVRGNETPAYCRQGSSNPSAQAFPIDRNGRQLKMYDPRTKTWSDINTCFGTHHLHFAEDADNTLYVDGSGSDQHGVLGWVNTRVWDETKDPARSQGWTPFILDTSGNGRRDAYVEPGDKPDPARDTRIGFPIYSVIPNPADGSVWGGVNRFPGGLIRVAPGASTSPATALSEYYELPSDGPHLVSIRGIDADRSGVIWAVLSSGHMASFDRRKCKGPLNGPKATGRHCPEGWSFHAYPGPQFKGAQEPGSADTSYYPWVDQHNVFGLGPNIPIATGGGSDSLLLLVNGRYMVVHVPYPMGFYAKSMDGRIDDPNAGWKGRGLWSTNASRAPFHTEGGKGTPSQVLKFQLRPNPLAK